MNPAPTATVTITQKDVFYFAISLSDGNNYDFDQIAADQPTAVAQMVADLQAMITAIQAAPAVPPVSTS